MVPSGILARISASVVGCALRLRYPHVTSTTPVLEGSGPKKGTPKYSRYVNRKCENNFEFFYWEYIRQNSLLFTFFSLET